MNPDDDWFLYYASSILFGVSLFALVFCAVAACVYRGRRLTRFVLTAGAGVAGGVAVFCYRVGAHVIAEYVARHAAGR